MIGREGVVPETLTLSVYDREAREFGVTWQTKERGDPVLEYTDVSDSDFKCARRVKGTCSDGTDTVKNSAVMSDLEPGKRYLWRVGDASGVFSPAQVMKAPDHDPLRLTFLNMTDTQDAENEGEWWRVAWQDALRSFPEAQLLVHTGDIVQEGGNAHMWHKMMEWSREYVCAVPMAPTSGNHDYWYGYLHGYDAVTEKHFTVDLPKQDTRHGIYYSFDLGPAHFSVLNSGDSMETDGQGLLPEQLEWIEKDLSQTNKPWKIVSVHNPLYSPGKYGSRDPLFGQALGQRRQLNEMLVRLGVDLVLCGHDHVYAQTYPIAQSGLPITDYAFEKATVRGVDARIAVDPRGPIHLESGCSGNQDRKIIDDITEEFSRDFEQMSSMRCRCVAYSAVEIVGDTLTVSYRSVSVDSGECVDAHAFGIRKTKLSD